jgi:hypothetical protein
MRYMNGLRADVRLTLVCVPGREDTAFFAFPRPVGAGSPKR